MCATGFSSSPLLTNEVLFMLKWRLETQTIEPESIDEVWLKDENGKLVPIEQKDGETDGTEKGKQGQ